MSRLPELTKIRPRSVPTGGDRNYALLPGRIGRERVRFHWQTQNAQFTAPIARFKKRGSDKCCDTVSLRTLLRRKKSKSVSKLLTATSIATLISDLLHLVVEEKPSDVVSFFIESLEKVIQKAVLPSFDKAASENETTYHTTSNFNLATVKTSKEFAPNHPVLKISPIVLLVVGLDGSGKSTLLSVLRGKNNPSCKPSLGFQPVSMKYKDKTIKFYDLGGGSKIRGIWKNYYSDVHGVIYIIDCACCEEKYKESIYVAKNTLGHKFLQGKPLLVISNKIDEALARPIEVVRNNMTLNVHGIGRTGIISSSLHPQKVKKCKGVPDPVIDEALGWLINTIIIEIDDLQKRVVEDSNIVQKVKAKEQEKKERTILSRSIQKAFASDCEHSSDIFDREMGEEFLAHELCMEDTSCLPQKGKEVAALVGYHKIALMMVSDIFSPRSSHKVPKSWEKIITYVKEIRMELNLSSDN